MDSSKLPLYDDDRRLFDGNTTPDATRWLILTLGFAVCGGVGLWTGYASWMLNGLILGYGCVNVGKVMNWLSRLQGHITRSEQIIWDYSRLTISQILDREELDRPLAAIAIKAKCG